MGMIRPEREAQLDLRFEVVPAYDLFISLAAAARPDRYELPGPWARSVRQSLPAAVRRDLQFFFAGPMPLGLGAIQLLPGLEVTEPGETLEAFDRLDTAELVEPLLGRRGENRPLSAALRRAVRGRGVTESDHQLIGQHVASLKAETRRRVRDMLDDPQGARQRFMDLVRVHHDGWFQSHYSDILPLLHQRAKQTRRSIGKLPVRELIARSTGGFTLQSSAARSATLIPSYYLSPFVFVVREGRDTVMVYGARPFQAEGAWAAVDGQSIKVLKALGDETRLRILQMLAHRPMYGQQLADALGVSHPTVSHHMAQLRIAGLTRTELAEDGSQLYLVQPETFEMLFSQLRATFLSGPRLLVEGG